MEQYDSIRQFVAGTVADKAPIIPISAQLKYNINVICEYICNIIPIPVRDYTSSPHLIVIRSFDINKPGQSIENLQVCCVSCRRTAQGGVAGGSLLRGVLQIGDEIEIQPGIVSKDSQGNVQYVEE